jgi:hypothetical protein
LILSIKGHFWSSLTESLKALEMAMRPSNQLLKKMITTKCPYMASFS